MASGGKDVNGEGERVPEESRLSFVGRRLALVGWKCNGRAKCGRSSTPLAEHELPAAPSTTPLTPPFSSSWPTIPQLYLDGEFIGGCDIVLAMHQSGELEEAFLKAGVVDPLPEVPEAPKA